MKIPKIIFRNTMGRRSLVFVYELCPEIKSDHVKFVINFLGRKKPRILFVIEIEIFF